MSDATHRDRIQQLIPKNPLAFRLAVAIKKTRMKAGFALGAACVLATISMRDAPLGLGEISPQSLAGLALVCAGVAFRIAALGSIKKNEVLATMGVYSLCRHPLYLGTMLLAFGLCLLMDNAWYFVIAAIYFAVFYSVTMVWEERLLRLRFGEVHQDYCATTPALMPIGRRTPGTFEWSHAAKQGAWGLVAAVAATLALIEALAVAFT